MKKMYESNNVELSKYNVMKAFWEEVAGKDKVRFGGGYSMMPLNYKTDTKEVIVDEHQDLMPLLDLRGLLKYSSLEEMGKDPNAKDPNASTMPGEDKKYYFEDVLTEYVRTYFESEKNWSTPINHCNNKKDQLVFCIAGLWLNATHSDYENPIDFIKRYTNFLKDHTFDDFFETKNIRNLQTLKNAQLSIKLIDQEEFQETPEAIEFTISKDGVEKKLPRVSFGISNGEAYIYGIQGYKTDEDPKEIKPINRARYKTYMEENYPEDYREGYKRLEPYSYISLFAFLCLLKQKGIKKVHMPSFLPERYESKEMVSRMKEEEGIKEIEAQGLRRKDRRKAIHEIKKQNNEHQRIQNTMTNKFLSYITRMECDVGDLEILAYPEQTNGFLVVDISRMHPNPTTNLIFYEIEKKIQEMNKSIQKNNIER